MMQRKAGLAATLMMLAAILPGHADTSPGLVERFYAALGAADAAALSALLAEDAEVELVDLDVIQSRAEFLGGLDEWRDAIADGTIRHRIEGEAGGIITVTVCYGFTSGEFLARETITPTPEGTITRIVQTGIGEDCGDL